MELTLDLRSIPLVYRELCGHQALAIGLFCSIEGLSLRILGVQLGFLYEVEFYENGIVCDWVINF